MHRTWEFQAQTLVNALWAFAKSSCASEDFMRAGSSRAFELVEAFNAQDLTNTAWALATVRFEDVPLLAALVPRFQRLQLTEQDLANTAWAFAKVMLVHPGLFALIAEQSLQRMGTSEPQNLANVAWAFATVRWRDEPLVEAMAEQCLRIVKQFGPQECANFAWALAHLMFVHTPCLAALGNRFVTGLRNGSTQNLTNTVWAYAQMKIRSTVLFYSVAQEASVRLWEFRERDLSITLWAFARVELRDEPLMRRIGDEAMKRDFVGKYQEIANLCWAMAMLDLRHKALLEMLSNAALSSDLAQFSSQELANTLWSSASLKFGSEAMVDAMARHVMAEVIPEAISQNIVNIAWALDCLGWTDQGEAFCRILQQFLKVCSGSLGVEWITLASLAEERRVVLPSFTAPFEALVLRPALRHLEALRHAEQACEAQVLQAMQDWVEDLQLPHMGPVFLTDALAAAGALASRGDAAWMGEARAAVKASAWWSCPKAAVSSQGVVAFLVAEIQIGQSCVRFNPGTVFLADDSLGPVLVERLLQPIFLQVPRHGHAERRAMVSLLRSALQTAASLGHHVKEATGWARLYASHYFCISCLAVLAQLGRQMPLVLFEVGCDDAWKSWEEREPNASYALQIGVPC